MQDGECPKLVDSLSAPMVGENLRIVMLSMKLRNSHLRNLPKSANFSFEEKLVCMLNPIIMPEQHSGSSWQYECNFLEGKKCKELTLVNRVDIVSVDFYSLSGNKHHIILPFRESRLLQYHMRILDGKDPMISDGAIPEGLPAKI